MGVEVEHFASGSRERLRRNLRPNEFILLFAGRLVEKKGVEDLLRAFAMLNKSLKDMARLWIVGDGSLMSSLQELATALGVRDKTEFFGSVPNHRLRDYYAAADLFVGPSIVAESGDTEGQGVVFIEAFAAGLCVIATRVGGIPEVVDDGRTGILVSPGSPAELAAAVQRLFSDPALRQRLAHNARDEARRIYSWPTIAEEFSNLYQNISTKP
jgi:glycosyltransferase involved in cell wall biosynthesis